MIDPNEIDPQEIDAVVLDAGGVLLLPDPEAVQELLAPFGVAPDAERCRRAHYASMQAVNELVARRGGWDERVDWPTIDRAVAAEMGVPEEQLDAATDAIEAVYNERYWVPIEGAAEALLALQGAGFRLAVVSNATGTMEDQLARHEICSVEGGPHAEVAIVVDSAVVGVEKPDPAIFGYALDALGVAPERCLYIGDTVYFDVNGARAAGLHPVHVDPYDLCPTDDHPHIHSLPDLVGALGIPG